MIKIKKREIFFPLSTLPQKEKLLILLIFLSLFLSSFFLTVFYQKISYQLSKKGEIPPSPSSFLSASVSLQTSSEKIFAGENFPVEIFLSSPDKGIDTASFAVKFDPAFLKVATLSAGVYFPLYPKMEAKEDSLLILALADFNQEKILLPKGKGLVAKIEFTPLSATESTKISFIREKTAAVFQGKNLLGEIKDLTLKIEERK